MSPRLLCLVDELQKWIAQSDGMRRHLEMEVGAFFELVTQQLDREERGHLFQTVADLDSSLLDCAEGRHREHLQLVERIECIRAAFQRRQRERCETADEHLYEMIQEFLDAWHEHERLEAQLLHDAFCADGTNRAERVERDLDRRERVGESRWAAK